MTVAGRRLAVVLVALAAWSLASAVGLGQQQGERLVTYAARSCPDYSDISANLARNDIQESLEDLGPDTSYVAGQAIDPAIEAAAQPECTPITDWRFTLGTGYQTAAVNGSWGSLSKVLGPYGTSLVTKATTPLLNSAGAPTGQQLEGAVTVALTADQAQRATTANSLWVQGGTVDDPVLNQQYPGVYGFGALRCAIDNLNGDNVEWIAYPQGARHVFCYAYYVTPPPTGGTIVVRKVVQAPSGTASQSFTFRGNITYSEDNRFSLSAAPGSPGSTSFVRAAVGPGVAPWTFTEQTPPGYELTGVACTSQTGESGTATTGATTSVRLAARDTVTCTYTNRLVPPNAGLVLSKVTLGGTGAFDFAVAGEGETRRQTITTLDEDVPRAGAPLVLPPGDYRITETVPARTRRGRWVPTRVVCDGRVHPAGRPVALTLEAGEGSACLFTNRFIPAGGITILKVTRGDTGTTGFVIRPVGGLGRSYEQSATTRSEGVPVRATGDATNRLRLGTYEIIETGAPPTDRGRWTLESIICDGVPLPAAQGRTRVILTAANPRVTCTFANRFVPGPEPPPTPQPPTPTPPGPAPPDVTPASRPSADLSVTKAVVPQAALPGAPVTYTVRVTNNGPDTATDVVLTEFLPPTTRVVRPVASQGTGRGTRPAACRLGTLAPGESATITVRTTALGPGTRTNRVAVLSAANDPDLTDNRAAATLAVRRFSPAVTG
ncbi:MAG: hypothetical protein AB7V62_06180 [Thermoleophilia bacterium]